MLEEMFVTDLDGLRKVNPTRYLFIHCPLLAQNGRANWLKTRYVPIANVTKTVVTQSI